MENKKVIKIYLGNEPADFWPIYSKDIKRAYCVSGNTGKFDEDGWYDTDDGFCGLDDLDKISTCNILEFAKENGVFFDVDPESNRGEWFFENKQNARKVFDFVRSNFIKMGYEIID